MTTSIKTCFKCRAEKPITDFYAHPAMGDGRLNKCKECARKDVAENYRANKSHYIEYERERFKRPERKEQARAYQAARRARFPEKNVARAAVTNAVRDGRLTRPEICENCKQPGKIEAHHHDYSKPLDVHWLCFVCHRAEHGQEAAA